MLQGYLAVGNKCAVDLQQLNLPIPQEQILNILWRKGFRVVQPNIIELAKKCVGNSRYKRGAGFYQAPFTVDCSTLTKWVYAKLGVWLPRHSIDQRKIGFSVETNELKPGDLVFSKGAKPYWEADESDGVGHLGIYVGNGLIVHAANRRRNVVEDPIDEFLLPPGSFRGIRRILTETTITLESPSNRVIEWSGEIRNIVLQNLR